MAEKINQLTLRFLQCLQELKANKVVKTNREFARRLGVSEQSLSEINRKRRNITLNLLEKAVEVFHFNPHFLLWGQGALFLPPEDMVGLRILPILVGESGEERILHVPVPAQAGYASGILEGDRLGELPSFTLPDETFKAGTHRCFDVAGDSMEPTLFQGDRVVCSFLEPDQWADGIKDRHIYVVVTYADVLVKRLINLIAHNRSIELRSDNPAYRPLTLPVTEVKEIWQVRLKMSASLEPPASDLQQLQQELQELKRMVGVLLEGR